VRDSWTQYDKLAHSADADTAGVQILSGAMFHPTPSKVNKYCFCPSPPICLRNSLNE